MSDDGSKSDGSNKSEDEWQEVYRQELFVNVCGGDKNHHLAKGTYYELYGGGPEGGLVVMPDGTLWSVRRDWNIPWICVRFHGSYETRITRNVYSGLELRLIE